MADNLGWFDFVQPAPDNSDNDGITGVVTDTDRSGVRQPWMSERYLPDTAEFTPSVFRGRTSIDFSEYRSYREPVFPANPPHYLVPELPGLNRGPDREGPGWDTFRLEHSGRWADYVGTSPDAVRQVLANRGITPLQVTNYHVLTDSAPVDRGNVFEQRQSPFVGPPESARGGSSQPARPFVGPQYEGTGLFRNLPTYPTWSQVPGQGRVYVRPEDMDSVEAPSPSSRVGLIGTRGGSSNVYPSHETGGLPAGSALPYVTDVFSSGRIPRGGARNGKTSRQTKPKRTRGRAG